MADDYDCYVIPRYRVRWSPYTQSLISGPISYSPYVLGYDTNVLVSDFSKYSPYAVGYNNSGLVSDYLHYSPYAFGYNKSGLVDRCMRYSPYAFGYNKSGLVYEGGYGYGCGSYYNAAAPLNLFMQVTPQNSYKENYRMETFDEYARRVNAEKYKARKAAVEEQKARIKTLENQKAEDPSEAISQYLKSKNIPFRQNRSLRMDGKTVSVNFDIEDANMIIKFWNSKEIAELVKEGGYKDKIYEDYFNSWKEYCLTRIGNKKVYNIIAGSKEEIHNMLGESDNQVSDEKIYAFVDTSK